MTDASESPHGPPAPDLWRLGAWTAELLSVPLGLVQAFVPVRAAVDARTREQLIVAVAEANGARTVAWVHGAWLDFLGSRDPDDALAPLFDYARTCAEAGLPLDTTTLDAVYPPSVVRSVRATVAVAQLGSVLGAAADGWWARPSGGERRPSGGERNDQRDQRDQRDRRGRWATPLDALGQAIGLGVSLPLLAPSVAFAGTMRLLTRLAPSLPRIELPPAPEANLVVHLLAEAAPAYLGHVLVRTGVVLSPVPVAVAFRLDGTSATIRVGQGRVVIRNGVEPDALAVVDGGVEPLLQLAAGSILKDLGVPVRRHA